jgi:branched-chain amino acid transport system substrate-binding protein
MMSRQCANSGTVGAAILALAVGTAIWAAPAAAGEPLKIGASISSTGTYSKPGKYTQEGYLLWEKQVNERGGLLGRPVKMIIYDDKSDPATSVKLYEKLITEDKVELVVGPYSSPVTNAASVVSEKHKMPMVASLAATTSIWERGFKYLFMTISPAEVYLEGVVDIAAQKGLKTVAVINEDTLFSKAAAAGGAKLAEQRGMKVVFRDAYPKGTSDFATVLSKIKAANPDVLLVGSYFDDAVAIARQMKELDVNPKMYGVTVGGDLPEFYQQLGKTAEYVYGSTQWEASLPFAGIKEFVEAYKKMWNHEPVYHSAAGYNGVLILEKAIREAGSLDRDKLRDILLKMKTTTIFGNYQVDERGFQIGHKMVIIQWLDGKKVPVWPKDVAEREAVYPTPPWSKR